MMSYLRPINFQPLSLECLSQESWLECVIRFIKKHGSISVEEEDEESERISQLRREMLNKYMDLFLPVQLQENAFHRGIQVLRKELSCNEDLFPSFFRLFWKKDFRWLHLPQFGNREDRISILDFLVSTEGDFKTENAKFRLFDRSGLNIQESYLMKRILRRLISLKHCVLWKSCDDAMLHILGKTCFQLETLDLWRSLNVTDSGILGLIDEDGQIKNTLRRIVLKDTSVSAAGAFAVALRCSKLEILDLHHGDMIQEFFGMVRKHEQGLTLPLKSLFCPVVQGKENVKDLIKMFPFLEDLTIWTACLYLKSFEGLSLPRLHSLKLGGLHSSSILTEFMSSVGHQLTALKIETMRARVPLNAIGVSCPNIEEFHVINAQIVTSSAHICSTEAEHFLKLKLVYFFLVQYDNEGIGRNTPASPLHCLLNHARNLEGIQATGSQDLSDECLKSLLESNPFLCLKRFMLTSPFSFSVDPPQVPLELTSASVVRLAETCPKLHCIGDLRHWNIHPSERKILLQKAQGWISHSETSSDERRTPAQQNQ